LNDGDPALALRSELHAEKKSGKHGYYFPPPVSEVRTGLRLLPVMHSEQARHPVMAAAFHNCCISQLAG
jgi:hypothetical protein